MKVQAELRVWFNSNGDDDDDPMNMIHAVQTLTVLSIAPEKICPLLTARHATLPS